MVARATMTLSSVSPAWPLKMTPWNSWQICYHSSTANKNSLQRRLTPKTLCNWRTEIFSWSYKLTTTLIELKRKFPSRLNKDWQLRRKNATKSKEKRLQQLFSKLTSKELAVVVFDAIKNNNSLTSIATIKAELTGKLVRRLHLYPLLSLPETNQFQYNYLLSTPIKAIKQLVVFKVFIINIE